MLSYGTMPTVNYVDLLHTFDDLPADQYAEPGYRFRRFSKFHYDGKLKRVDTDHFMQSKDLNQTFGDIERKFEPIADETVMFGSFNEMFKTFHYHTECNDIDCHQVRIVVEPGTTAPAAPEGRHQDGYDFIGAFIVTRRNLIGGDFMVWESMDPNEEPIFQDSLLGMYGIIDDRKYYHTGNDLSAINPAEPAVWEWFVLGGRNGKD